MGGSSAGPYLADPTSPIPSHCASIVATSTVKVNDSELLLYRCEDLVHTGPILESRCQLIQLAAGRRMLVVAINRQGNVNGYIFLTIYFTIQTVAN